MTEEDKNKRLREILYNVNNGVFTFEDAKYFREVYWECRDEKIYCMIKNKPPENIEKHELVESIKKAYKELLEPVENGGRYTFYLLEILHERNELNYESEKKKLIKELFRWYPYADPLGLIFKAKLGIKISKRMWKSIKQEINRELDKSLDYLCSNNLVYQVNEKQESYYKLSERGRLIFNIYNIIRGIERPAIPL